MKRNWTMLATVLQVDLSYTSCYFVRYNLQKLFTLDWPVRAGRTTAHNVFTATPGAPRSVSCTIATVCDVGKMFIHESKLRSIVK